MRVHEGTVSFTSWCRGRGERALRLAVSNLPKTESAPESLIVSGHNFVCSDGILFFEQNVAIASSYAATAN